MGCTEWKALDSESDPCHVPSKWWLSKPFQVKAKLALPPPQALALLALPSPYRLPCLAPAEEGHGLCFQVQGRD